MRYYAETHLPVDQVLERAEQAFGPASPLGLRLVQHIVSERVYADATGFVALCLRRRGPCTCVSLETREYDAAVQRFLAGLPGSSWLDRVRGRLDDWVRRQHVVH